MEIVKLWFSMSSAAAPFVDSYTCCGKGGVDDGDDDDDDVDDCLLHRSVPKLQLIAPCALGRALA